MAIVQGRPTVELHITIQLSESEARALDAMAGYGDDQFVKAFYEKLGKAYMHDHEGGLRSFLTSMRSELPQWLGRARNARDAFQDTPPATPALPAQPVGESG